MSLSAPRDTTTPVAPTAPPVDKGRERNKGTFRAEPVVRPRQQVETQIKQAILDGAFPQGERLPSEAKLADAFGVSRTTVREALRGLAESGLIATTPGSMGGSFVQQVDHHALSQIVSDRLRNILGLGIITYEEVAAFRDMLEVPSARLAAQHHADDDLAAIHEIIDDEKGTTVDDPQVLHLNAAFHSALANASHNRVLGAFVSALHRIAHPLAFIDTDVEVGRRAVEHHIDIYKAVADRDPDRAAAAMAAHLNYLDAHSH
jgi:GntR family transcriptional regulator, transcriptional repressor for pyruvate dehydrogenase complex